MKKITITLTVLIALLSLAAGIAKVMQTPKEIDFLTQQGLSLNLILIFGSVQIAGGLLMHIPKTTLIGNAICCIAFLASSVLLFKSGNVGFGLFSLLPVIISIFLMYKLLSKKAAK
ncbi:MAG: DoxX family protein [Gammaproteobacteria bacterium]|nr:DoxX family protein [Gammaproteobacteria bacterium]